MQYPLVNLGYFFLIPQHCIDTAVYQNTTNLKAITSHSGKWRKRDSWCCLWAYTALFRREMEV